jgi:hypothetical protein
MESHWHVQLMCYFKNLNIKNKTNVRCRQSSIQTLKWFPGSIRIKMKVLKVRHDFSLPLPLCPLTLPSPFSFCSAHTDHLLFLGELGMPPTLGLYKVYFLFLPCSSSRCPPG